MIFLNVQVNKQQLICNAEGSSSNAWHRPVSI